MDLFYRGSGYDMGMYVRELLKEIIRRINFWWSGKDMMMILIVVRFD